VAELTRDETRYYHVSDLADYPVAAGEIIYEGAAVGDNGAGYARALLAGDRFLGFATRQTNNSIGIAGAIRLLVAGADASVNNRADVYASDDNTFTLIADGNSKIGNIVGREVGNIAIVNIRCSGGGEFDLVLGKEIKLSPVQEPRTAPTATNSGVSGVLNGTYQYMCTFVTADGETEGRVTSGDISVSNKKINLTDIPVSADNRVIARNIYRKPASASADVVPLNLLVQIADNTTTTYQDNIDDASLGVLINRINTTGGKIFKNDELVAVMDTSTTSIGWDSSFAGTGYASTAVGIHTMPENAGLRNNAFGMYANYSLVNGFNNNAFGVHALQNNVSGDDNCAFGHQAAYNITMGQNVAIGTTALYSSTIAVGSVAIGYQAAYSNVSGLYNIAIGYQALKNHSLANASSNVAIGWEAGSFLANGTTPATGLQSCVLVGTKTRVNAATDINSIVIGRDAVGAGSNTVVLGHTTVTQTYLRGGINLNKTVTAAGTTGAQTINNPTGSVNFAAAATSLVVTNSLVTANSIIQLTVASNDATMKSAVAVAGAGSFTIYPNANPTAETRVNFTITN
jgi:hypothetical protein